MTPTPDGQWWQPPRCPAADLITKNETKKTTPTRGVNESRQGPRRAVARLLGVQPGIKSHSRLLLQIGQLLEYCNYKAMPSTWRYGVVPAVGQRRCHSSKIGGGELLKAAQQNSLEGSSGHRLPHHIDSCKTSWRGYLCRSPPPACHYNGGGGGGGLPFPPRRAGERLDRQRQLPDQSWVYYLF